MKTPRHSPVSSNLWLSLATSPFLVGMLAFQSLTQALIELGQASEEIFRGERLPILNFPEQQEQESTQIGHD